jgi:hypothetical protein
MNNMGLGSHYSGTTKSYPADAGTTLWSRFEVLAAWPEQLPRGPGDVLGALLAATHPRLLNLAGHRYRFGMTRHCTAPIACYSLS